MARYYEPDVVEVQRCRRGRHCCALEPVTRLPAVAPRALCDPCTDALRDVIAGYPELLLALAQELPTGYVSMGDAPVSGGDPEPGLPINVTVDELMRDLVDCAREWADRVRDVIDEPTPAPEPNLARALGISVNFLSHRISVLLAMPERGAERVPRFDRDGPARRLDGGDGALELLYMDRQGRAVTGQIKRLNRIVEPCGNCGVAGGVHTDGDDPVRCLGCRKRFKSRDHYLAGLMIVDQDADQAA